MSAELPLRENEMSSRKAEQSCMARLCRPEKNDTVCLILLIVNPRWLSLSGLTLLLTASDMAPACEASLIVLG